MWCSIRYRDPAPTRDICAYNSRQATKVGDPEKDVYDQPAALREHGKLYYLWINLSRPFVILFGSLICFVFGLYLAL